MNRFQGRIAVVSGAAGDVGRLLCQGLAGEGARVVGIDVAKSAGEALEKDFRSSGLDFTFRCVDVADPAAIEELAASESEIDILINNAGVLGYTSVAETSLAEWERIQAINLRAPFLLTKAFASAFRAGGSIVNMSSGVALRAEASTAAYTASKAGLVAMSKVVAAELAPKVRVNVVCPGVLDTAMPWRLLEGHPEAKEIMASMASSNMQKRLGKAEEVVPLCLFLVSDDASFITGATIAVDGGRSA